MMAMSRFRNSLLFRLGIGLLTPFATLAIRYLLRDYLPDNAPFQFFVLAMVVAAWLGGFWAGIVSCITGMTLVFWFFIPHFGFHLPNTDTLTRAVIFIVNGIVISVIGESMRRALNRERAHRLLQYRLAAIVENTDDAIVGKNLKGIVQSWNRGAEALFGYTADEIVGNSITILIPEDRLPEEERILSSIARGERISHFETVRRRKDGTLIDVALTISPIKDADGKIIGASKIAHNITEQKRNEATLRERENQLRLITDHAPVYLAQLDRNHCYKFVNRPYAVSYNRQSHEIIGMHISQIIGNEAYTLIRGFLDEVVAGEQVESELQINLPLLGLRWMYFIFVPEFDEEGSIEGFVVVITDITQRKRSEEELEKARDEALAASQAKDNFLGTLSHELRTPLNPVLLLASDAMNNDSLPPEIRTDFELIFKNVSLEARLIDDMLDLTRITQGKITLNTHVLDTHLLLRECVEIVRNELNGKLQQLNLYLEAQNAFITGDPVRLQQIFWNLLRNAIKFTPYRGEITLRTRNVDGSVLVEVSDSGIGLTPAEIDRAFKVFSQGEHADKGSPHRFGGLGLGLAICKLLVELHQGDIQVSSGGRDLGATFTVRLPSTVAPAAPIGFFNPAETTASAPLVRRILLIEDHDITRDVLSRLLRRHGHDVYAASDGASARALASESKYDLVISDLGLPDCDGHSLMSELYQTYGLNGIALSGYGMEKDIQKSMECGFYTHLTKPVQMDALLEALANAPSAQS